METANKGPGRNSAVKCEVGPLVLRITQSRIGLADIMHSLSLRVFGSNRLFGAARVVGAMLVAFCLVSAGLYPALASDALESLVIESSEGVHAFEVEIADDPEERRVGLMHRKHLPADRGMLFDHGKERVVRMWMKNTYIPLDMLFIGADGRIRRIAANTTPHSETIISSMVPVRAVLEVPGGTAERLAIRVGDRVNHQLFTSPP